MSPPDAFLALAREHRTRLKVAWRPIYFRGRKHVIVISDWFNHGARGSGAQAMREICALADRLGVFLQASFTLPYLEKFFTRYGFTPGDVFPMANASDRTRACSRRPAS